MRLATKNEIITILDDKIDAFAQFYLSDPIMRFKWDSTTNFDLDLPVMQNMVSALHSAGVIDAACVARFAAFGVAPTAPDVHVYKVPTAFPRPADSASWADGNYPDYYWLTVPYVISDPQAKEVAANGVQ